MDLSSVEPAFAMMKTFGEAARHWFLPTDGGSPEKNHPDDKVALMAQLAVAYANGAFDFIAGFDVLWHTEMFSGATEYKPGEQEMILKTYGEWHANSIQILPTLDRFEAQGRPIQGADKLRANVRKAKGALTPDDDFFEGEELDRLAEEALAADDRGETVEFTEMGR
jgi:hypothetical protein